MQKLIHCLFLTLTISTFFLISCKDAIIPIPETPTDLEATVISQTQVDLAWIDNSTSEAAFRIERKLVDEDYEVVALSMKDVNTYSDTTLSGNTSYSYRVNAINSELEISDYSNEVCATTPGNCWSQPETDIAKIMTGTWDVIEFKIDSTIIATNTGEKFTFFDCTLGNCCQDCRGIFQTADGEEENFGYWFKGGASGIFGYGLTATIAKYHSVMQGIDICAAKKLVFGKENIVTLTLEKHCSE